MGLEEWSGGETETPSLRYHYVYPPDLLPTPTRLTCFAPFETGR